MGRPVLHAKLEPGRASRVVLSDGVRCPTRAYVVLNTDPTLTAVPAPEQRLRRPGDLRTRGNSGGGGERRWILAWRLDDSSSKSSARPWSSAEGWCGKPFECGSVFLVFGNRARNSVTKEFQNASQARLEQRCKTWRDGPSALPIARSCAGPPRVVPAHLGANPQPAIRPAMPRSRLTMCPTKNRGDQEVRGNGTASRRQESRYSQEMLTTDGARAPKHLRTSIASLRKPRQESRQQKNYPELSVR